MSALLDALSRAKRRIIPRPTPPGAKEIDAGLRRDLQRAKMLSASYVYQRALFEQHRFTLKKYLPNAPVSTLHIGCGNTLGTDVLLCADTVTSAVAFDPAVPVFEAEDFCCTWATFHAVFAAPVVDSFVTEKPLPAVQKSATGYRIGNCELRVQSGLTLEQNGLTEEFDYAFSNATLEHVYDPTCCVRELHRLLRTGGVTAHQIDLRDHLDFSRPLDFLRFSHGEWTAKMQSLKGDTTYMNRWRLGQWRAEFEAQGFEILECFTNLRWDAENAEAERPFLNDDYRNLSTEELCALSVWLVARKI